MNTYKNVLVLLVVSLFLFNACVEEVVKSDKAAILEFYIPDRNGSAGYADIEFEIRQPSDAEPIGLIQNTEDFPYGAFEQTLIPYFTTTYGSQFYYNPKTDSVAVVTSGRTAVQFSSVLNIYIIAPDGFTQIPYQIKLTASNVNPTGMIIGKTQANPSSMLDDQLAFRFKEKTWILSGSLGDDFNSVTSTLVSTSDGSAYTEHTIDGASFPVGIKHNLAVYNNKAYILGYISRLEDGTPVAKNEIWESENGTAWTKTGTLPGAAVAFRQSQVFKGKLWVFGGSQISNDYSADNDVYGTAERSVHVLDASGWNVANNLPSTMPTRYGACGVHHNKLFYIGGESETGFNKTIWASEDGENWISVVLEDFLPISKAGLLEYDDRLWLIGGEEMETTSLTAQTSVTEGLFWRPIETLQDEGIAFMPSYTARAGVSSFVDENMRIWIIGGYSIENGTKIYHKDVYTGIMNKYLP